MPPGVASPDKVETRPGTLNFFDGFPDKASVDKLYDNLDFQRAVQASIVRRRRIDSRARFAASAALDL
jgi:hypothetical protein